MNSDRNINGASNMFNYLSLDSRKISVIKKLMLVAFLFVICFWVAGIISHKFSPEITADEYAGAVKMIKELRENGLSEKDKKYLINAFSDSKITRDEYAVIYYAHRDLKRNNTKVNVASELNKL